MQEFHTIGQCIHETDNHLMDCTISRVLGKYTILDGGARDVGHKYLVGSDQEPGCSAMVGCSGRDGARKCDVSPAREDGEAALLHHRRVQHGALEHEHRLVRTRVGRRSRVGRGRQYPACCGPGTRNQCVSLHLIQGNMLRLPMWASEMFLLCTRRFTSQISL